MPVACLYDIHGNLPALEAVLEEVRQCGADHVVVGGDVLPGPFPRECLDLLYSLSIPTEFISHWQRTETEMRRLLSAVSGSRPVCSLSALVKSCSI